MLGLHGETAVQAEVVDVNAGYLVTPIVRSRFCAKTYVTYKSGEFFAAMPPLEALGVMASHAASGRRHGRRAGRCW